LNLLTSQHNRLFAGSLHLTGVAVVALALGGFYALVYQPLQHNREGHRSRSEQLDRLLIKTGTERTEYRRLRKQLRKTKASADRIHRQLAGRPSEATVIEDLSDIAADVGLEVLDYQIGLTEKQQAYSQTEVEFRCHGSYASICKFLEQAEQLTETTKLSKFELNSEKNSLGYPIQLTFVLYSEGQSHDTKEKRGVL